MKLSGGFRHGRARRKLNKPDLRGSVGCHPLERPLYGIGIRTEQELLGHSDVSTTLIYIHVRKVAAGRTTSPLDSPLTIH